MIVPPMIAVLLLMAVLAGILLWGIRRAPAEERERAEREIAGDDPPREPLIVTNAAGAPPFIDRALAVRRFLSEFWGDAAPDLTISYWSSQRGTATLQSCTQQFFLPLAEGADKAFASLETRFFDGALEEGIREGSPFLRAFTFIRSVPSGCDLVVESTFRAERFEHKVWLADTDGSLKPLGQMPDGGIEYLAPAGGLTYRRFLAAMEETQDGGVLLEKLAALTAYEEMRGLAHAWMAWVADERGGLTERERRRHLALAGEFNESATRFVELQKALMHDADALGRWMTEARGAVRAGMDDVVHGEYLLAQGLWALRQPLAARTLCRCLLTDSPWHPGASRLLHLIDQGDRGEAL